MSIPLSFEYASAHDAGREKDSTGNRTNPRTQQRYEQCLLGSEADSTSGKSAGAFDISCDCEEYDVPITAIPDEWQ